VRAKQLSYRRRRRLVALTVAAAVAGGVTTAIVLLPTGESADRGPTSLPAGANDGVAAQPTPYDATLSADDRKRLKATIALFVISSVARHHPERSWSLVDPALRQGLTRQQWGAGNIPVVPYPATGVDLLTLQSVVDHTALVEVVLEPSRSSHLPRKTFQIELRQLPPRRWLVSSWVPEGVSERQDDPGEPASLAASHASHLSTVWLVLPLGLLIGGMILVPAGLFVHEAYQFRRAKADFERPGDDRASLRS
jgi:hypothetical protein